MLEPIKKGKVCDYCGELIFGDSVFCRACGVKTDYSEEKEKLIEKFNTNVIL